MSSAIQIQDKQYVEMKMKQYHNDDFIKGCMAAIQKILEKAPAPPIIVDMKTLAITKFDGLDDITKHQINYWKLNMEKHVLDNYSDIIFDGTIENK